MSRPSSPNISISSYTSDTITYDDPGTSIDDLTSSATSYKSEQSVILRQPQRVDIQKVDFRDLKNEIMNLQEDLEIADQTEQAQSNTIEELKLHLAKVIKETENITEQAQTQINTLNQKLNIQKENLIDKEVQILNLKKKLDMGTDERGNINKFHQQLEQVINRMDMLEKKQSNTPSPTPKTYTTFKPIINSQLPDRETQKNVETKGLNIVPNTMLQAKTILKTVLTEFPKLEENYPTKYQKLATKFIKEYTETWRNTDVGTDIEKRLVADLTARGNETIRSVIENLEKETKNAPELIEKLTKHFDMGTHPMLLEDDFKENSKMPHELISTGNYKKYLDILRQKQEQQLPYQDDLAKETLMLLTFIKTVEPNFVKKAVKDMFFGTKHTLARNDAKKIKIFTNDLVERATDKFKSEKEDDTSEININAIENKSQPSFSCFSCGEPGHISRFCGKKSNNPQKQTQPQLTRNPKTFLRYMDMTPDQKIKADKIYNWSLPLCLYREKNELCPNFRNGCPTKFRHRIAPYVETKGIQQLTPNYRQITYSTINQPAQTQFNQNSRPTPFMNTNMISTQPLTNNPVYSTTTITQMPPNNSGQIEGGHTSPNTWNTQTQVPMPQAMWVTPPGVNVQNRFQPLSQD